MHARNRTLQYYHVLLRLVLLRLEQLDSGVERRDNLGLLDAEASARGNVTDPTLADGSVLTSHPPDGQSQGFAHRLGLHGVWVGGWLQVWRTFTKQAYVYWEGDWW